MPSTKAKAPPAPSGAGAPALNATSSRPSKQPPAAKPSKAAAASEAALLLTNDTAAVDEAEALPSADEAESEADTTSSADASESADAPESADALASETGAAALESPSAEDDSPPARTQDPASSAPHERFLVTLSVIEGFGAWSDALLETLEAAEALNRTWVEPCVRNGCIEPCRCGHVLDVPAYSAAAAAAAAASGNDPLLLPRLDDPCKLLGELAHLRPVDHVADAYPLSAYIDVDALQARYPRVRIASHAEFCERFIAGAEPPLRLEPLRKRGSFDPTRARRRWVLPPAYGLAWFDWDGSAVNETEPAVAGDFTFARRISLADAGASPLDRDAALARLRRETSDAVFLGNVIRARLPAAHRIFSEPLRTLPISQWHERGVDAFLAAHKGEGHFAAFHWRSEHVEAERIAGCAANMSAIARAALPRYFPRLPGGGKQSGSAYDDPSLPGALYVIPDVGAGTEGGAGEGGGAAGVGTGGGGGAIVGLADADVGAGAGSAAAAAPGGATAATESSTAAAAPDSGFTASDSRGFTSGSGSDGARGRSLQKSVHSAVSTMPLLPKPSLAASPKLPPASSLAVLLADIPAPNNLHPAWGDYVDGDNVLRRDGITAMLNAGFVKYDAWALEQLSAKGDARQVDAGVLALRDYILSQRAQLYYSCQGDHDADCKGCFRSASNFIERVARDRRDEGKHVNLELFTLQPDPFAA